MNAMKQTFRLTAIAAALMAVFGTAVAEEDEVAELIAPDSRVSLGGGNWSKDRPQQGIYDGMRDKGAYGLIDADIVKRNDDTGTWMTLRARNLGLETREVRGEYLRQGNLGLSLEYSRIPRDNPYTFTTRWQDNDESAQTVFSNATAAPVRTLELGTYRDLTTLGFQKILGPNLEFKLSFKNEEKDGWRNWGRGSAAEFVAEPLSSTTRQVEGILNYTTKNFQLSGGYHGSWFYNSNSVVIVTTPGAAVNANNPTHLSLPLDNHAHKLFLNGGYSFTPTTRGTFKLAYTRAIQDERLHKADVSSPARPFADSPDRLDGEVNSTLVQLGLTSRPLTDLSLVGSLRFHNVEDETPVRRFVQTNAACNSGQCVDNTPFSYKTLTAKLEGTYRLADGYSLTVGAEERRQDRHVPVSNANGAGGTDTQRVVPMRSEVDETTGRVELRRSLSETLNGSVGYSRSDRTGSTYSAAGSGPGGAPSDLINPINIADRTRDKVRLGLDWTPVESLSFQVGVEGGRDDYDTDGGRPYGLDDGTTRLISLDVTYSLNEIWQINAWYSHDYSEATQFANWDGGGATATKRFKLEDRGDSLGFGVRGELTSRFKLGADLQWTRTVSKYDQTLNAAGGSIPAGFSADLPDIENRLVRLGIFSTYAIDKQSDVRVDLIHERWRTDDWTWMFATGAPFSYGTTTDGTTVTAKSRQTSNFIGVRYLYSFQ